MFRKLLFWTHLICGVVAGLVILLMSVTGVLLTYEKQMVAYMDRRAASIEGQSTRLSVQALLTQNPRAGNVTLRSGATEPVSIVVGRETQLVDPYTGAIVGAQDAGVRAFFRSVTDWHRWLGVSGQSDSRTQARIITGASNLIFLFIVMSGLYLWLPRVWEWKNVRAVSWFRRGLSSKARDFNWHNTIGLWSFVPLFVVVLSGVVISYPWASDLVYKSYGERPPSQAKGKGKGPERAASVAAVDLHGLDTLVARAQAEVPTWTTMTFAPPTMGAQTVSFNIDAGSGGQPYLRSTLVLDRETANVVRHETFELQDPGRRARTWMRFVHTGEYYGLLGQTIAGIASLGATVLVWTGLALSWRRFWAWRDRRS
jgi:uncharacterized iron-regulated membrane protein